MTVLLGLLTGCQTTDQERWLGDSQATARDQLFADSRRLSSFVVPELDLGYWSAYFTAETIFAKVICNSGSIQIELYLEREQVVDWIGAAAGDVYFADMVVDDRRQRFQVVSVEQRLNDLLTLYDVWTVTLAPLQRFASSDRAWLRDFASAANVAIETPTFEIILSPAEGDPENRAAFVEACMAM